MNKIPTLADLICEYANERMPQYHITSDHNGLDYFIQFRSSFIFGLDNSWHLGIVSGTNCYITLKNDKFIWIDMRVPGSLDVVYRLFRLDITRRIIRHRRYIKTMLSMPNRKTYLLWYGKTSALDKLAKKATHF